MKPEAHDCESWVAFTILNRGDIADTTIGLSTLVEGFFQESKSRQQNEA
ncbi:MAG: hypothetical protein WBD36_15130 [Bacteroidota bacterium]